jgi:hypothetical protein
MKNGSERMPWMNPSGTAQSFHVKQWVFMNTEPTGLTFLLGLAGIEDGIRHLRQLVLTGFGVT